MNYTSSYDLTWEQFASCHSNPKEAFEDLTRQLFNREFCPDVHLVAADNNPGIETEPVQIMDSAGKKLYIGFQSKHFTNNPNYADIKDSCKKAVKYYSGKLDVIYLYCNKNLNSCPNFDETQKILSDAGIELKVVANKAILDMLRDRKYSDLALPYFGIFQLTEEWFSDKAKAAFEYLDERFNRLFNVDTEISAQLSLFLRDDHAVANINKRKSDLLEEVQKELNRRFSSSDEKAFLTALQKCISTLPDINNHTIPDALDWNLAIKSATYAETEKLTANFSDIETKLEAVREKRRDNNFTKEEKESSDQEYTKLRSKENDIEETLSLAKRLVFTTEEQALIKNKILFIKGEAGTGKSHLLANELHTLIDDEKGGILILGQTLHSSDFVEKQILSLLEIGYSFSDFLTVLDNYGVVHNQIIPFMIDAINETWNRGIWKVGLDKIVRTVESTKTVRLIITYRNEYQNGLLSDSMKRKVGNGSVITLSHNGFRGVETEALTSFLNHYNIPFSPTFYFEYDFSNPLFLSLFCRTYQKGEEQSLPALYDRLLDKTNEKVCERLKQRKLIIDDSHNILADLVNEFCRECIKKGGRTLTRKELLDLSVWKDNGLRGNEGICITEFVREKFFSDIVLNDASGLDDESYYFAYDQMFDYYYAKYIYNQYCKDEEGLIGYIVSNVLVVKEGRIRGIGEDIFIIICAFCGKDKGYHIFDTVLDQITNNYDKEELIHKMFESYSWRNVNSIGKEELGELLQKYSISCDDICNLFILNSTKQDHPYNAEYMHSYLMKMPLNVRDYNWTIQINGLVEDGNRLWQLIQLYERGEKLEYESQDQKKLFLNLLSWILTSSNRSLRDHTSKAMVEILKDDFALCEWLLRKFEKVNDPYVIQRLFTITVGAVLKRKDEEKTTFKSLTEYVFTTIFNQEYVYPDILLRDSARIIVERFLYEYPDEAAAFNPEIFRPPYRSEDIPVVERKEYKGSVKEEKEKLFGMWNIIHSLRFEGMGMYGDFGRYVFQSAIDYFDVPGARRHNLNSLLEDEKSFQGNIYYYALHYIFEDLGYTNELFGIYDSSLSQYSYLSRSEVLKTERIGKKYEWIAMYNILARISDRYKVYDFDGSLIDYEGAWQPGVRDFDPTYNHALILEPSSIPSFEKADSVFKAATQENYIDFGQIDFKKIIDREKTHKGESLGKDPLVKEWLFKKINFFKITIENLLIEDQERNQWVVLSRYIDKKAFQQSDINGNLRQFDTWTWTVPFIARREEAENIVCRILKHRRGSIHGISEYDLGTYSSIYNREFPWSPSCNDVREAQWQDLEYHNYSSGRDKSIMDAILVPELDCNSNELRSSKPLENEETTKKASVSVARSAKIKAVDDEFSKAFESFDEEKLLSIIKKYRENEALSQIRPEKTVIGRAMSAATSLSVSFQYDATAFDNDGNGYSVTCLSPDITEKLKLTQGSTDGFFYDQEGNLAVIDTHQYGGHSGIVIRKDLLDKYLSKNNMSLFWAIYGEKQIFTESHMTQEWSEWEGAFLYKDGEPIGRLQGFRGNQS